MSAIGRGFIAGICLLVGGALPPAAAEETPSQKEKAAAGIASQELMAARQAFWEGRYTESVQKYRSLLEQDPERPSIRGELGNVLYAQGKRDAAAKAYFQAAVGHLDRGEYTRANDLYHALARLDASRANDLAQRLWHRR